MIVSVQSAVLRDTPVDLLPLRIKKYFFGIDCDKLFEIRMRAGKPLCVAGVDGKQFITHTGRLSSAGEKGVIVSKKDIEEAVEILTSYSLYSYKDQIKNGFITAPGGHRVGICGTMTPDSEFITDVSCLNYRFAREIFSAADKAVDAVYNNGQVKSTLIVSAPGCGKTTFLRDLIRQISNKGVNISVVDERGELAAVRGGIPGFDLGFSTDVLDMCDKRIGMKIMLRTMTPSVIAVDEFDVVSDADIISALNASGVSVFATVHTRDWNKDMPASVLSAFKCVVVLSNRKGPGTIEEIIHV